MARPVTLFTGQWADLPLDEWGDHFDVEAALADDGYCRAKRAQLERHRAVLPPDVWGDGDPEGVRFALEFVRRTDFAPSAIAFDAQFR